MSVMDRRLRYVDRKRLNRERELAKQEQIDLAQKQQMYTLGGAAVSGAFKLRESNIQRNKAKLGKVVGENQWGISADTSLYEQYQPESLLGKAKNLVTGGSVVQNPAVAQQILKHTEEQTGKIPETGDYSKGERLSEIPAEGGVIEYEPAANDIKTYSSTPKTVTDYDPSFTEDSFTSAEGLEAGTGQVLSEDELFMQGYDNEPIYNEEELASAYSKQYGSQFINKDNPFATSGSGESYDVLRDPASTKSMPAGGDMGSSAIHGRAGRVLYDAATEDMKEPLDFSSSFTRPLGTEDIKPISPVPERFKAPGPGSQPMPEVMQNMRNAELAKSQGVSAEVDFNKALSEGRNPLDDSFNTSQTLNPNSPIQSRSPQLRGGGDSFRPGEATKTAVNNIKKKTHDSRLGLSSQLETQSKIKTGTNALGSAYSAYKAGKVLTDEDSSALEKTQAGLNVADVGLKAAKAVAKKTATETVAKEAGKTVAKEAGKTVAKTGATAAGSLASGIGIGTSAVATVASAKAAQDAWQSGDKFAGAAHGVSAVGSGLTTVADAATATGIGAIVGVPLRAVGMALSTAGTVATLGKAGHDIATASASGPGSSSPADDIATVPRGRVDRLSTKRGKSNRGNFRGLNYA